MKIVFVGAGNLACNLARALVAAGHVLLQVYSRTEESAGYLAGRYGGAAITDLSLLSSDADAYIIAVKDSVLPDLLDQVCKGREDKVFMHTSGSVGIDIFAGVAPHHGVFYPMQTFSRSREVEFSEIPCFIEYSDPVASEVVASLANSVSGRVIEMDSEKRRYLHLAAVFANNFVNHCYALSEELLRHKGIPFDIMLPLIDETACKVHGMLPHNAQTGPAVRYDENVIQAHLRMLDEKEELAEIYKMFSLSIHNKRIGK